MEQINLKAMIREEMGKGAAGRLRKEGKVPAVVYKGGKEGISVKVDAKELWRVLHTGKGGNVIINMEISGAKGKDVQKTVIIQETQQDPVNDRITHVDFHEISLKEKIRVKIPVAVKGEAKGVAEDKGVLGQIMWELEVECLPTDIPEKVDVHVEEMRVGDIIFVKDVKLPEGVVSTDNPDQVVLSLHLPKAEEEAAPEAEPLETEPELIKKGKKEEEEVEAEGEAKGEAKQEKKAPSEKKE